MDFTGKGVQESRMDTGGPEKGGPNALRIEDASFLVLVLIVTLVFAWLIAPYFGAILWGLVAGILFSPVYRWILAKMPTHRNGAAALTLLMIVTMVIAPAIGLGFALIDEATALYIRIESGQINFEEMFRQLQAGLPEWASALLARSGLDNFADARDALGSGLTSGFQTIATHVLSFGQGAFKFIASLGVMLYLTFFLLRDGEELRSKVVGAIPLRPALRDALVQNFTVVIRATVKGSIVVGIVQGLIGGLIFWALDIQGALLWGVLMGIFSLVPAVGSGFVWAPVSIYLLATGSVWQGLVLIFCGVFVIGLIDNILRPLLVGKDTRMPDFVVLISTVAGIELIGLSGFVVGPAIAALFMAVWTIMTRARGNWERGGGLTP